MNLGYLEFIPPNFEEEKYKRANNVESSLVYQDGIAPDNFYLTSHSPTYYKYNDKWILPNHSSLNCVAVIEGQDIIVKELRDLKVSDRVITGKFTDGSNGILKYKEGFSDKILNDDYIFAETSSVDKYNRLYQLMEYAKNNNGYIVWVLGPAVVFDHDTRESLTKLARAGYVNSLLGGNAMATHDLEGGFLKTALGQDIYTQESKPMGHYNHLDLLNEVRREGSIDSFIKSGKVEDGFIKTLNELNVPITLAGSIRDDGPLPEVEARVTKALENTKKETDKATLVLGLATMLHSVSTAEIASTYRVDNNGRVFAVPFYTIDVTENAVNKVFAAREGIAIQRIVTNVQDFVVNLERDLLNQGEFKNDI